MSEYVGFYCPQCDKRWANPQAQHVECPDGEMQFRNLVNASAPKLCEECKAGLGTPLIREHMGAPPAPEPNEVIPVAPPQVGDHGRLGQVSTLNLASSRRSSCSVQPEVTTRGPGASVAVQPGASHSISSTRLVPSGLLAYFRIGALYHELCWIGVPAW